MARSFSDAEKEAILRRIIAAAEEMFTLQGYSKTTVAEIARAAGIGKGTFYLFFGSKDEVVWALHDSIHESFHKNLTEIMGGVAQDPRQGIRRFLQAVFDVFNAPLVVKLQQTGDFDRLMRAMSHDHLEEHNKLSVDPLVPLIEAAQQAGLIRVGDARVIAGTIRGVCFLGLHQSEIGEDVYPQVVELLIDLVADGLTQANEENRYDN